MIVAPNYVPCGLEGGSTRMYEVGEARLRMREEGNAEREIEGV